MCITVIVSSWHIGTDLTVLNKLLVLVKHILSNINEKTYHVNAGLGFFYVMVNLEGESKNGS